MKITTLQALVVQRLDSAIYRINLYPVDSAISFPNTYLLDSDLSVDSAIRSLNNRGQKIKICLEQTCGLQMK